MDTRKVPTKIDILSAPLGKLTAGDVVVLRIEIPEEYLDAQPEFAENFKDAPLKWGEHGRILFWEKKDGFAVVHFTSYQPGKVTIPPIAFKVSGKTVFSSESKEADFVSVGQGETQPDIYHPQAVAVPKWVWVSLSAFVLLLTIVVIAFVARAYRRKKARLAELAAVPKVLTPIEKLIEVVRATNAKNFLNSQKYKPYYFALSDGAKRFLGEALRFDAEEKTTRELSRELDERLLDKDLAKSWVEIFEEMDVVKFTDQSPTPEMANSLADRLLKFAQRTS